MDDVINLITSIYTFDSSGNQIPVRTERQVFCKVLSIGRTEFYQAAQNDLHPDYVFVLSHFKDYNGEKEITYTDWTGVKKRFDVIRTYRNAATDELEITVEERIGDGNGEYSSSDGEDSE